MPTYVITAPDGRKFKVTGPGTKDEALAQVQQQYQAQQPPEQPQSGTDVPRTVAIGGRAVGEGVLGTLVGIPEQFGRAVSGQNIRDAIARSQGVQTDPTAMDWISTLLTKAGAPVPETPTERIGSAAVRGASGALAFPGAGVRPLMTAISGASGGASAEGVKELGGGPVLQTLAGFAGGLMPYAVSQGAQALGRGAKALAEPFYGGGREKVVGRVLNEAADDPIAAQQQMANAGEIVPNSRPTAAESTRDYGIINAERSAKTTNPAPFAARESEQNLARQQFLDVASKDQAALKQAVDRRETVTTALRDKAFQQAQGKAVDSASLTQQIDDLIAQPENAGATTQSALKWARDQVAGKTDPQALYAVRKDIAMKLAGKVGSEESVLRYAGGTLSKVNGLIDDAIQEVAPSWKEYLVKYRQLSKPIDRMEALQTAQEKSALSVPDAITGRDVLSQAKWRNQAKALLESGGLTKGQQQRVERIVEDLDRGMRINDPNIRAIGSNTTQDMTAANVLGQALGSTKMSPLVRSLARPLQWVYKIPEQELQDLLSEALLDPRLGAALMEKASTSNMSQVSSLLRQRFLAASRGAAAAAVQPRTAPEDREKQQKRASAP